jgi:hypothetical protein
LAVDSHCSECHIATGRGSLRSLVAERFEEDLTRAIHRECAENHLVVESRIWPRPLGTVDPWQRTTLPEPGDPSCVAICEIARLNVGLRREHFERRPQLEDSGGVVPGWACTLGWVGRQRSSDGFIVWIVFVRFLLGFLAGYGGAGSRPLLTGVKLQPRLWLQLCFLVRLLPRGGCSR